MKGPLRLAAVGYLNTEPLVHDLRHDPGFEIVSDVPSRVADRLHAGECDLGLIPSVEYAFGDYAIVPGISLASRGPVRSVNLYHRVPVAEIRSVALDVSSRTSVALTKVLLHERLGRAPEYRPGTPDIGAMLKESDAALVIGDPALYYEAATPRIDLGDEWFWVTGLPFVFAFWAGRPGAVTRGQVARLQEAARRGLGLLPTVAVAYNGHAEHAALNEDYLRHNMVYALGEDELRGLREFYRRAHALSLVPRVPELRFHGDS